MVRKFVNKATAPVVFWQQLTSKDYSILNADQNYRNADIVTKLKDLQKLYNEGALTKEEFENAKKKILN